MILKNGTLKKLKTRDWKRDGRLQCVAGYLGRTLVCVWSGELREGYNCYFEVFLVVWEVSFLWGLGAGRWAIILWGLDTFLILSNFLRS